MGLGGGGDKMIEHKPTKICNPHIVSEEMYKKHYLDEHLALILSCTVKKAFSILPVSLFCLDDMYLIFMGFSALLSTLSHA